MVWCVGCDAERCSCLSLVSPPLLLQAKRDIGYTRLWSSSEGLHLTLRSMCNLRNPDESTPQHNNTGEVQYATDTVTCGIGT